MATAGRAEASSGQAVVSWQSSMQRIRRAASLGVSPIWVLSALWLAGACSFDWDSLEPRDGASATGGDAQGGAGGTSSGTGAAGTGAVGTGGGDTAGATGSGGGSTAPGCTASVLVNSDFEDFKNTVVKNWVVLNPMDAAGGIARSESGIQSEGERSMAIDTSDADPMGNAYQLLVGTPVADMVSLDGADQVTTRIAVRVETLEHGSVTVAARFQVGTNDFEEVPLATLSNASSEFVTVGDVVDVPLNATNVGLVISVPDAALVFVDDACAELD